MPQLIEVPGHGQVEFPDGMSDDDIAKAIKRNLLVPRAPSEARQPTTAESVAAHPAIRFALGAASPVIAGTQALDANTRTLSGLASLGPLGPLVRSASMVTEAVFGKGADENARQLERMKKEGGHEGMDWWGLAGTVASPGGWRMLPTLKQPTSTVESIRQGMGVGATSGVAVPATGTQSFEDEKATQAAFGFAAGAIIPAIVGTLRGAFGTFSDVSDLFTAGGPQRIFQKYHDKILTKNPQERQQIIDALKQADELVAGSKPTAAEAVSHLPAASPMLEYQRIVAGTPGGPSGEFGKRTLEQEGARRSVLQGIGKDRAALEAAEGHRAQTAATNYGAANQQNVATDITFDALVKRPSMEKAMNRARELAEESGQPFVKPKAGERTDMPVQSAHYMKMALDDMISNPERFGIGATEARAIGNTRTAFVSWLERKVPEYGKARTEYAADSRVIDRMKIGQALEDKLVSATEKETPSTFANAIRNELQTIKRATGQPRYDELSQIMTPEEVSKITSVLQDVQRKSRTFNIPQKTNLFGGVNVAEETRPHLPNLLSRPAMIANFLLKSRTNDIEKLVDQIASRAYLNPDELAGILAQLPTAKRNAALRGILDSRNPIIPGLPVQAGVLAQE